MIWIARCGGAIVRNSVTKRPEVGDEDSVVVVGSVRTKEFSNRSTDQTRLHIRVDLRTRQQRKGIG